MVWLNFNWLTWNSEQFGRRLDDIVRPVYASGLERFTAECLRSKAELSSAEASLDQQELSSYLDWVDEEFRQRCVALSAMVLSLLARDLTSYLDELLRTMGRQFTTDQTFRQRSRLLRQVAEYHARFAIDLEAGTHFETVREIVLARNDALHRDSVPQPDYLGLTSRRLVDEAGELNLTPELLDRLIAESKIFASWIAGQLSALSVSENAGDHDRA